MKLLWPKINGDLTLVLLSLVLQVPLAIFLGHYYDQRVFMVTGYLAGSGLDPYQQYNIAGIFSHPLLQATVPRFGYPPIPAFALGWAFQLSYGVISNLYLYNFAIKIPIIVATILLAFLVRNVIMKLGGRKKTAKFAFMFFLFNPVVLLTSTAWGQFDVVVALLTVTSFYLLTKGKNKWCALTLALAFSIKPIILPLLGLPVFFGKPGKSKKTIEYLVILIGTILFFLIIPFLILNWHPFLAPGEWNAHFKAAGGLSIFGIVEIANDTLVLPQSVEILGFLWIPALLIGYYWLYRNPPTSPTQLFNNAVVLILIFFLTRSWLSEQNMILVLPLMLITLKTEPRISNFNFAWIITFFFMFLNYSIPKLFFLPFPTVISDLAALDAHIRTLRLYGKFFLAVIWQILAWMFLFRIINRKTKKNLNLQKSTFPSETVQSANEYATYSSLSGNSSTKSKGTFHGNGFLTSSSSSFNIQIDHRLSLRLYHRCQTAILETAQLQKGLILLLDGTELAEEGVGFGVPVAIYKDNSYFASSAKSWVQKTEKDCTLFKEFILDAVSRKRLGKSSYINDQLYRFFHKIFEKVYLSIPELNKILNKIMELTKKLKIQTEFIKVKPRGTVTFGYTLRGTEIQVHVLPSLTNIDRCREIVILNEQGSTFFRRYADSNGSVLFDRKIGPWNKVDAKTISFSDIRKAVTFTMKNNSLFPLTRGWERTKDRFSWAGFAYSLPPKNASFCYSIRISSNKQVDGLSLKA